MFCDHKKLWKPVNNIESVADSWITFNHLSFIFVLYQRWHFKRRKEIETPNYTPLMSVMYAVFTIRLKVKMCFIIRGVPAFKRAFANNMCIVMILAKTEARRLYIVAKKNTFGKTFYRPMHKWINSKSSHVRKRFVHCLAP